ncbi:MAG: hypothetical protein ACLFM7_02030 [Bacteroidales bacterium]
MCFISQASIRWCIFLISFLFFSGASLAQDSGKSGNLSVNGYLKYMNTIMDREHFTWTNESMFHNRFDFRWDASRNLRAGMSMRNRFIYGDLVESFPSYNQLISRDYGYLHKLTRNLIETDSYIFNTSIDRLWVNFTQENFEAKVGRQRINWGQAFVWNPNDIFNAYSFFDFDYEEKPGSDAIRLMYYPSLTSTAELALKVNRDEEVTAAGYYRMNLLGYDWQFLGGMLNNNEYVAGMGWSGNIKGVGFNGEMTYIHPDRNLRDTSGLMLASLSANYMFNNSLFLQFEGFYNGNFRNMNLNSFTRYYYRPLTVKTLSFSELSWFAQASYPIHPLLEGKLAFMYFPDIEGFFINPSLRYSLTDNIQLSAFAQLFEGKFAQGNKQKINFIFFRFKWSF